MTTILSGRKMNADAQAEADAAVPVHKKKFPVVEIFGPTIQGEGAMLGIQTMFLRFGGCDFRCVKCDSLHAVLPEQVKKNAVRMTTEQILEAMAAAPRLSKWITFSGGNPVMHQLQPLVQALRMVGHRIAVETQGSLWEDWLMYCDHVTVSPKGPGMGETFSATDFDRYVKRLSTSFDRTGTNRDWSIKVVIMSAQDIEFAKMLLNTWPTIEKRFYLSLGNPYPPEVGQQSQVGIQGKDIRVPLLDHYAQLVEDILNEPMLSRCKVTPQLHVLFWGNRQGV